MTNASPSQDTDKSGGAEPHDLARELRLYQWEYCPYCRIVRQAAERLGVPLELVQTDRDRTAHRFLVDALGRGTVPVLRYSCAGVEHLLPESRDIIAFLERYVAAGRPANPCEAF